MDPSKLKYAKTHEWIYLEGDVATLGITDFAVKQLTDLVYIDLPQAGRSIERGESFGEVESVKAVSDLYAPLAGQIIEVNTAVANDLSLLSDDPFGAGWIIRLKVSDSSGYERLLDRRAYEAHCAAEAEEH